MRATYYFLHSIGDIIGDINDLDDPQELLSIIESSFFEYDQYHCDENNWWHVEGAVLADNRAVLYHGNPSLTAEADAWSKAWLSAYQAVAFKMAWYSPNTIDLSDWTGKLKQPGITANDIDALIESEIPKMLAAEYAALAAGQDAARQPLLGFQRSRTAQVFELYLTARHDGCVPFTQEHVSPYEYRAFDLTGGGEGDVISMVDIHT